MSGRRAKQERRRAARPAMPAMVTVFWPDGAGGLVEVGETPAGDLMPAARRDADAPEPFRGILRRVRAADAEAMAEEVLPSYVRPFVPGELWPLPDPAGCYGVRVLRVAPGVCARLPICEAPAAVVP